MQSDRDDDFWEDLLTFIEEGRVIPVIGEGAVTFGPDDALLYPWLALRLADRLKIEPAKLPPVPTVNDVVCAWLIGGGARNTVYTRLQRILRDECPPPGKALRDLAAITAFKLFLTTTFDPLLQRAVDDARFGGQALSQVCAFFPEASEKDLPARRADLTRPTIYHVLGRVSPSPEFVAWEEDVLEFICALQQHINTPVMERLARDLKEHGLLVLGLNFSDWLARFFMRIAKQSRLSESRPHIEYLAEGPAEMLSQTMVLFFGGVTRNIHVVPCQPSDFIAELARRWQEKHPASAGHGAASGAATVATTLPSPEMPPGAIFISYAREDETVVLRLKAGLEAAGCQVWYDRERLKPGGHWINGLVDEVKGRCALFLSVISRTTESTPTSYYHQERNWAQEYYGMFAQGRVMDEYYVPVVVDDSPLPAQREPRIFEAIQATRLPGGEVTDAFGQWLRHLQEKRRAALSL